MRAVCESRPATSRRVAFASSTFFPSVNDSLYRDRAVFDISFATANGTCARFDATHTRGDTPTRIRLLVKWKLTRDRVISEYEYFEVLVNAVVVMTLRFFICFLPIILKKVFLHLASLLASSSLILFSYALANFSKWFLLPLSDTSVVRNFLFSRKIKFQK